MAVERSGEQENARIVQFRIERGAQAIGTDGALGSVQQIVVDRETGELRSLVIRSDASGTEFELPASHITNSTGEHVYLDIGRNDLASHPNLATPYEPEQYMAVNAGNLASPGEASESAIRTEHPVVTQISGDAVQVVAPETTADLGPAPQAAPAALSNDILEAEKTHGNAPIRDMPQPAPQSGVTATPSTSGDQLVNDRTTTSGSGMASLPVSTSPNSEGVSGAKPMMEQPATDRATNVQMTYTPPPLGQPLPPTTPLPRRGQNGGQDQRTRLEAATAPASNRRTGEMQALPEFASTSSASAPGEAAPVIPTSELNAASRQLQGQSGGAEEERAGMPAWALIPAGVGAAVGLAVAAAVLLRRGGEEQKSSGPGGIAQLVAQATHSVSDASDSAQDAMNSAKRGAKRGAKRARRRAGAFRNGFVLGGALSLLFAPERGSTLRERVIESLTRRRSA